MVCGHLFGKHILYYQITKEQERLYLLKEKEKKPKFGLWRD